MVVRSLRELYELLDEGYIPYYHRRVRRWYLRRDSRRILVGRELEAPVKDIADELSEWMKV